MGDYTLYAHISCYGKHNKSLISDIYYWIRQSESIYINFYRSNCVNIEYNWVTVFG